MVAGPGEARGVGGVAGDGIGLGGRATRWMQGCW